jgi:hypothetical protein
VVHRDWNGDVELFADGTFGRPSWGEANKNEGTWSFQKGTLTLKWTKYPATDMTMHLEFDEPNSKMTKLPPAPK